MHDHVETEPVKKKTKWTGVEGLRIDILRNAQSIIKYRGNELKGWQSKIK
jgi:hypothetical protein